MKKIQKFKKILNKGIQMYFSREFLYREQIVVWIFADLLKIIGLTFVWFAVSKVSDDVSQNYIISYYLLVLLLGKLTSDYVVYKGPDDIVHGKFTKYILKPFNYLTEYLSIDIGRNILRFVIFLPAFILGVYLIKDLWIVDFNPYRIFLSLLAICFGFVINFLLGNIFSLIAFFTKQLDGLRTFYFNIASLLSGEYIPIVFLPFLAKFIVELLPFRYTLSFPVEIILGNLCDYEIKRGFFISFIWCFILFIFYFWLYKKSVRKYEAEGI